MTRPPKTSTPEYERGLKDGYEDALVYRKDIKEAHLESIRWLKKLLMRENRKNISTSKSQSLNYAMEILSEAGENLHKLKGGKS